MIYGYARVSTLTQAKDGNSLEAQEQLLRDNGAELIYCDAFTGTRRHRPAFDQMMTQITDGDTLIVTKLDRIARSSSQGCELIMDLLDKGIRVNVLNLGVMDNSPTGKLIRTILFAFAEFERDMIVERTAEGKAIARKREGYREGRPRREINGFDEMLTLQSCGHITVNAACLALDISRTQWYRLKRQLLYNV